MKRDGGVVGVACACACVGQRKCRGALTGPCWVARRYGQHLRALQMPATCLLPPTDPRRQNLLPGFPTKSQAPHCTVDAHDRKAAELPARYYDVTSTRLEDRLRCECVIRMRTQR
eukprot:9471935-Pyramimonas_sp.AAC.2